MSILRFTDGQEFDTSGDYRIEERYDGLYVVGNGLLMAVKTREEGIAFIEHERRGSDEVGRGNYHDRSQM